MTDDSGSSRRLTITGPEQLDYDTAREKQLRLRQACEDSKGTRNYLMLVEHPPVITLGQSADRAEVLASDTTLRGEGVEVKQSSRGGRVTFHGPGQLVGYPILDLRQRGRDLHRYLRDLEAWLIEVCEDYNIEAQRIADRTGVWVGDCKIAAIGVAARRWCSYHGVALNVSTDLSYFDLIVPCGLRDSGVTSLEEQMGEAPEWDGVVETTIDTFCSTFDFPRVTRRPSVDTIEVP